ncbi:MAG: SDR family NAD(P)-dependent oxidoreductase [Woeseiaceae bacterium]
MCCVDQLQRSMAIALGPKGITVNVVAPGMVMTDMTSKISAEMIEGARSETVIDRLASTDDIAEAVLFLLSKPAGMITGTVLKVDGGQYL